MADLPDALDITNSTTQGALQTNLEKLRDVIAQMFGGAYQVDFDSARALTIASGAITPTMGIHDLLPETGSADILTTINTTNFPEGRVLVLRNVNSANSITIDHTGSGAGHIELKGSADLVMSSGEDVLFLLRDPTSPGYWVELFHHFGTVGGGSSSAHSHFNQVPTEGGEAPDGSRTEFTVPHDYESGSLLVIHSRDEQLKGASDDVIEDAKISPLATANWVTATKKLSQTGAFAAYTWVSGDSIYISGGTGITPGWEVIAGKDSDDQIELVDASISGVDLSNSDITSKRAYKMATAPLLNDELWCHVTVAT